jgi:hypothetical protein
MREPLLILDSRERWRPVPVEALAEAGATVGAGGKVVDVDHLPEAGGRINLPPDADQPWNANWVGYWRKATGGGLTWFQFWTFWLYNPKTYAGVGAHEGDWEMVQLGCTDDAGDRPVLMTCSQHDGGEKREFWRVTLDEKRPVVYVEGAARVAWAGAGMTLPTVEQARRMPLKDLERALARILDASTAAGLQERERLREDWRRLHPVLEQRKAQAALF